MHLKELGHVHVSEIQTCRSVCRVEMNIISQHWLWRSKSSNKSGKYENQSPDFPYCCYSCYGLFSNDLMQTWMPDSALFSSSYLPRSARVVQTLVLQCRHSVHSCRHPHAKHLGLKCAISRHFLVAYKGWLDSIDNGLKSIQPAKVMRSRLTNSCD